MNIHEWRANLFRTRPGQFPWQAQKKTPQPPAPATGAELPDTHKAKVALGIGQDFVQGVMGLKIGENPMKMATLTHFHPENADQPVTFGVLKFPGCRKVFITEQVDVAAQN
jgi:hypothetical protein